MPMRAQRRVTSLPSLAEGMPEHLKRGNIKQSSGKAEWDQLPLMALEIVARVMGHGGRKYGYCNWSSPRTAVVEQYMAACLRHMARAQGGEILDPESGLPHLAHGVASLLIALHHQTGQVEPWK